MRQFRGKAAAIIGLLYIGFVGWSLYGAIFPVETYTFRLIHFGFILLLAFLVFPISEKAPSWTKWIDWGLALLGVACVVLRAPFDDESIWKEVVIL